MSTRGVNDSKSSTIDDAFANPLPEQDSQSDSFSSENAYNQKRFNLVEDDDKTVSLGMQQAKRQLLDDVKSEIEERRCLATFSSIWQYVTAEHERNPKSVKIGIITVFILAMVISFFKSVVDVSPILFVKVGQEQVGAIDFVITPANNAMISAQVNYYAVDPWHNPFALGDQSH